MKTNNNSPKFLNDFFDYLTAIKGFSKVYIENLSVTLHQFINYINKYTYDNKYSSIEQIKLNDIRSLSNSDIYGFIYYLAENKYEISSRITKLEHLRLFFDYLFRIQHNIFVEPFKKIKREKNIYTKLPNYLSYEESRKVLLLYKDSTKINEIRDNAMVHLFLLCGLRISEVRNLNIDDIQLNRDTFLIFGKGNKERTGYLNKVTKNALEKYIKLRKNITPKGKKDNNALFLNHSNTRISPQGIRKSIRQIYKKIGLEDKNYSVHTLRHTCATTMYKNGVDINVIREILGHVQIDTTEIYTHLHNEKVQQSMLSHPLSKFKINNALEYDVVGGVS